MKLFLMLLAVFPFCFASVLAFWSLMLLRRAIGASVRPAPPESLEPPGLGLAFGAVVAAAVACVFGHFGFSILLRASP